MSPSFRAVLALRPQLLVRMRRIIDRAGSSSFPSTLEAKSVRDETFEVRAEGREDGAAGEGDSGEMRVIDGVARCARSGCDKFSKEVPVEIRV